MSPQESIILGVISGIITTLLISLSLVFFNKIFLPWYRSCTYGGIDISGEWASELNTKDVKESALMIISQKANSVTAQMTVSIHHKDDGVEQKIYNLRGEFENRFLSLTGKNSNNKHIGVDVSLLEVINGGKRMSGIESWFSTVKNAVDSEPVIWIRK
jgi:hypothetical protein